MSGNSLLSSPLSLLSSSSSSSSTTTTTITTATTTALPASVSAAAAAGAVASIATAAANAIRNSNSTSNSGSSNSCNNTVLQTTTTPEGGDNKVAVSTTTNATAVAVSAIQQLQHQQHHQHYHHHHHHHHQQQQQQQQQVSSSSSPSSSSSSSQIAATTTTTTIAIATTIATTLAIPPPSSAIVLPTQPNSITGLSSSSQVHEITCNLCPKTFASQKLLQQHQHMFHTDKAFICEICGKAFRFRSNLAEHRSVHTALKPYVCKFCGKSSRLKGNLTKHILKHHKQEQNAYIGKDDIIIKKGKKSVKDPAAVDFLEKSMIVLTSGTSENPLNLPAQKDEAMDDENDKGRSIFMSLGLDTGSMDLRSTSPEEESIFTVHGEKPAVDPMIDEHTGMGGGELDCDEGTSSPLNNISTNEHLTSLIAHMANNTRTQCPECGKHFRKGSSLQVHMTLNHGFPPPGSSISSDDQVEKCSDCGTSAEPGNSQNENPSSAPVHQEIKEIKSMIGELRSAQSTARVEQLLTGLDTRVGRLEKQLEMALNSIYTLVQLQTGINSSVTRFREEACEQLKTVKAMLSESSV